MRYTNLDFLRGICLLIMTIDHFGDLGIVRIFGFFTAAEGFVFISGIVSGIVYYRRYQKTSQRELRQSAFARALKIYKYHLICAICLVLLVILGSSFIQDFYTVKAPFFVENPLLAGILNALFIYKTYHLDILPIYVIFLLLIPVFVAFTERFSIRRALVLSAMIWGVNLFGFTALVYQQLNSFIPASMGGFNVLAWQFLFFTGFGFGIRQVKTGKAFNFQNTAGFGVAIVILVSCFVIKWSGIIEQAKPLVEQALIGKQTLGVLKLVNFLAFCYVAGFLVSKYNLFQKNSIISTIGKHSLYVFTFHILILFLFIPYYQEYMVYGWLEDFTGNKIIWKSMTLAMTIPLSFIIYLPAWYRERANAKIQATTVISRK